MPLFRIHRIKEAAAESFRWAPHTGGAAVVKPKDYDSTGEMEALTPYAAWKLLKDKGQSLRPGDVLEALAPGGASSQLWITKYIGFEPATWYVPEPKPQPPAAVSSSGETSGQAQSI